MDQSFANSKGFQEDVLQPVSSLTPEAGVNIGLFLSWGLSKLGLPGLRKRNDAPKDLGFLEEIHPHV